MKATMKWLPFMSTFILDKMCEIVQSGVRTEKGFKEVHLVAVAKALFEHYGAKVSSTQVYNHLRKWRVRLIHVTKLRALSGAQWCEDTNTIILESEHCQGHVTVSTMTPTSSQTYYHTILTQCVSIVGP